jgi:hypothetical protein
MDGRARSDEPPRERVQCHPDPERDVLTPERFRYALACGVEHLRQEIAYEPNRRPALERERTALTVRIARMVAA